MDFGVRSASSRRVGDVGQAAGAGAGVGAGVARIGGLGRTRRRRGGGRRGRRHVGPATFSPADWPSSPGVKGWVSKAKRGIVSCPAASAAVGRRWREVRWRPRCSGPIRTTGFSGARLASGRSAVSWKARVGVGGGVGANAGAGGGTASGFSSTTSSLICCSGVWLAACTAGNHWTVKAQAEKDGQMQPHRAGHGQGDLFALGGHPAGNLNANQPRDNFDAPGASAIRPNGFPG